MTGLLQFSGPLPKELILADHGGICEKVKKTYDFPHYIGGRKLDIHSQTYVTPFKNS